MSRGFIRPKKNYIQPRRLTPEELKHQTDEALVRSKILTEKLRKERVIEKEWKSKWWPEFKKATDDYYLGRSELYPIEPKYPETMVKYVDKTPKKS